MANSHSSWALVLGRGVPGMILDSTLGTFCSRTCILSGGFMNVVESSQLKPQGKANHPFKKRHLLCYLILTEKSRVPIFIILSDISFLLSSPDQMVVVLLNCFFTVFFLRFPFLMLLDLSDLNVFLACRIWQMANMLVKCWADLNGIPFFCLVFMAFWLIFSFFKQLI